MVPFSIPTSRASPRRKASRYRKVLQNIRAGRAFTREKPVLWHCRNCGYIYEGTTAPDSCPACRHPQAYYELWAEMY